MLNCHDIIWLIDCGSVRLSLKKSSVRHCLSIPQISLFWFYNYRIIYCKNSLNFHQIKFCVTWTLELLKIYISIKRMFIIKQYIIFFSTSNKFLFYVFCLQILLKIATTICTTPFIKLQRNSFITSNSSRVTSNHSTVFFVLQKWTHLSWIFYHIPFNLEVFNKQRTKSHIYNSQVSNVLPD